MAAKTEPPVAAVEAFVAAQSAPAALEAWTERISGPILEQGSDVAADAVLTQELRASVRAHWLAFLASLPEPPREVKLVQAGAEFAAELARRGHPVTVLFRVYRVAQQAVWDYVTTAIQAFGGAEVDETDFLVFVWSRASQWIDASVEASVDVFQVERDRIVQGTVAQRLDTVRSVLRGDLAEPREVSALLGGHPLSAYNTALLLQATDVDRVAELGDAVTRLAQAVGAKRPLVVNPGGRDLWCWLASSSVPDLDALSECEPWLRERRISVAVGTPAQGIDGFRLSHTEAQRAQAIAFQSTDSPPLTRFADVELLSLLAGSADATHRFVRRTLGDLAGEGEAAIRLRETLHALLSTGSVDEASKLLMVHKNTVRYRVNQAEALLGHSVGEAATELAVALRYFDTFLARS